MDVSKQLKDGKFWSSGNAHASARGWKGGSIKSGKELFIKRLSGTLGKFKAVIGKIKPATLYIDISALSWVEKRQIAAVVKRELQPSLMEIASSKTLYAWWD